MKHSIVGLSLLAVSALYALPAGADCTLFNTLVKEAEVGKGFTGIVPFRAGWDLRDRQDTVPAQFAYPSFDTCWIEDNDWKNTNGRYGDPRYTCTLDIKPAEGNTISMNGFIQQSNVMGQIAQELRSCTEADERFKIDKISSQSVRYMMKPELTEMRGLYDNPRVWIEVADMENPPVIEDVPPAAAASMPTPGRLTFTVFGLAQDFDE